MSRPDPHRAYRFQLEIARIQRGSFQSVSGLERECKIEPYREGGANHYEHQLVTLTTYPPLVLKRGLVDYELWDWHQQVISGDVERQNIAIILLDESGNEAWRWICEDAFPSKWSGAELDATSNAVATESIEFVHHGLVRQ
jgi:phage tail-like protein